MEKLFPAVKFVFLPFNCLNLRRGILYILPLLALPALFSCRATRYVPEDAYLLKRNEIEIEEGDFERKELTNYIKQKPNKRIFFWRFYLSLYNLSSPHKDNGFHNWLRDIGEPPVVYDPDLKDRTREQFYLYLCNKGYYHASVTDTTLFRNNRAWVKYRIKTGQPYRIRDISYFFHDGDISRMVLSDTGSNAFRKGEPFDVDVLQKERLRIETLLRNRGYYKFSRDFVYFEVDSALNSLEVDITLGIRNYPRQLPNGHVRHGVHPVYQIRDVYMQTLDRGLGPAGEKKTAGLADTLVFDSIHLLSRGKPAVRPSVLTQKNYIIPSAVYCLSDVQRTYRNLSALSALSTVDVRFKELKDEPGVLDCYMKLMPAVRQSYTVKLEGTNSGGNIGAGGNFIYQHKNLFGGSEQLDLTFLGAVESLRKTASEAVREQGLDFMQEYGVEARLRIPKFLLPFRTDQFIRQFNPQTSIRLTYNYQNRPQYNRTLANASFGYEWKGNEHLVHRVWPAEASLILTPYIHPDMLEWLAGKYLFYSYEPHMILNSRYSVAYNTQKVLKRQDFIDVRYNLESAGNLLYGGYRMFKSEADPGDFQVFGVDFAQYIKTDIDFRSYHFFYDDISLVFRGFAGVGFAYGNSTAMPFEKQYFSGGANGIRAWRVKNLGPGSYDDQEETSWPNQTGDVKLEANVEYRFRLFWKLEGALFLDAGNIWSLSKEDDRPGAGFEFDRFYKEFAVGTGFGARLVFNFFILRFDLGVPLRNPFPVSGSNWLPGNAGIGTKDLSFNIGIGYPF